MATFGDIKSAVSSQVVDQPAGFTTELPKWINSAVRDAQRAYNFRFASGTLAATTTAATRLLVAKPSTWKESRDFPWRTSYAGLTTPLGWLAAESQAIVQYDDDPDQVGPPEQLLEGVDDLFVYPYSDGESDYSDGEYRISIPYWAYLPELSGDAATNWFTLNAERYLAYYASALAMIWIGAVDPGQIQALFTLARAQIDGLVRADKRSRLLPNPRITPRSDVLGPTNQPWRGLL